MKKLVALTACALLLAALVFADGKTALALAYPDAAVTAYDSGATATGGVALLRDRRSSYTLDLGPAPADRILELLDARVVNAYTVEEIRIIEAYSPLLAGGVVLPEGRVNVQIAVRAQSTLVGLPMLVGGY